jgi:hypothetical protein
MDYLAYRDKKILSSLQLYSTISLFIAAKAVELDKNIPFIPKLRENSSTIYSKDDYRKAE